MQGLQELLGLSRSRGLFRTFAAASGPRVTSVYEKCVSFWLVDEEGRKKKITALDGDDLASACAAHVNKQNVFEAMEGVKDFHAILPKEWASTLAEPKVYQQVRRSSACLSVPSWRIVTLMHHIRALKASPNLPSIPFLPGCFPASLLQKRLRDIAYALKDTSRIASDVTITKANEGMIVAVGHAKPETHDMTHVLNSTGRSFPPGVSTR